MNGMDRRTIPLGEGPDLAINGWLGRGGTILRRRGLSPSNRQPAGSPVLTASASFASNQGSAGLAAAGSGTFQGWMDPEPEWGDVIQPPSRPPLAYTLNMIGWEQRIGGVLSISTTDQLNIAMVEDLSTGILTGAGPGTSTSYKPDASVCAVSSFTGTFTMYRSDGAWYLQSSNYFFSPINLGVSDPRQTIPLSQSGTAGVISCLWPANAIRQDTATLTIS